MTNAKRFLAAALAGVVCGCYSFAPAEIPATAGPLPGNPKHVEVTKSDGTTETLFNPVMGADSLVGSKYISGQGNVRLAIARTDITNLKASTFSPQKTVGGVILFSGLALVGLYIALSHSTLGTPCQPAIC